jgi:hypothetical protein
MKMNMGTDMNMDMNMNMNMNMNMKMDIDTDMDVELKLVNFNRQLTKNQSIESIDSGKLHFKCCCHLQIEIISTPPLTNI